jgi:hypothetical protein
LPLPSLQLCAITASAKKKRIFFMIRRCFV